MLNNVANPYHFETDPDPGFEKIHYGSRSGFRPNFNTEPDPGKKGFPARKIIIIFYNKHSFPMQFI